MIKASIDIGSNTLLLLIAETDGKTITPLREEQRVPRLGKGVDNDGNLAEESMQRALDGLKEYNRIISEYGDIPVRVTATSATRDSKNGKDFIIKINQETGFVVQVLTGDEEALTTYRGALSMVAAEDVHYGVIDIGGGSTEIALGKGAMLSDYFSFDMGCVRYTERYLKTHPANPEMIESCKYSAVKLLNTHPLDLKKTEKLIGVAGTVTSLAYLVLGMEKYDAEKVNGCTISLADIQKWQKTLNKYSIQELEEKWPVVMKGRADIFLTGLIILEVILKMAEKSELTVSSGGIRHGSLLR